MKDFNEYAKNAHGDENAQNAKSQLGDGLFGLVSSLAGKFDGKSQSELIAAIYKEAKKGKAQGTLTNADIDNFVNTLSPFLDEKKRGYLLKIAKELKKI